MLTGNNGACLDIGWIFLKFITFEDLVYFEYQNIFTSFYTANSCIAQPDIAACGGISEFLKICALASTFGVTIIPHVWGSAVGLAAGLHAVSALPLSPYTANPIYLENEVTLFRFQMQMMKI